MPFAPIFKSESTQMDIFNQWPELAQNILSYTEILLRGPGPFTPAEREFIASYVSGVNGCKYCHTIHARVAAELGADHSLILACVKDLDSAPMEGRWKILLSYLRDLTLKPTSVTEAHANQIFAAGWSTDEFHYALSVCAIFNFYNRIIEGHGIKGDPAYWELSGKRLAQVSYTSLVAKK